MNGQACKLLISELQLSPRLQCRVRLDKENLKDFIEAQKRGDVFPPVTVFRIEGKLYVVDGHHRLKAILQAGHAEILAVVHDGTWHEAVRAALAANKKHGIRLTAEDRAAAVLLATKELPGESTRSIAELCGISHRTVGRVLRKARGASPQVRKFIQGRDGKKYPVKQPARPRGASQPASLAEPAAATSVPPENQPISLIPNDSPPPTAGASAPVVGTQDASLHPKAITARDFVRSWLRLHPEATADIARVLRALLCELGQSQDSASPT